MVSTLMGVGRMSRASKCFEPIFWALQASRSAARMKAPRVSALPAAPGQRQRTHAGIMRLQADMLVTRAETRQIPVCSDGLPSATAMAKAGARPSSVGRTPHAQARNQSRASEESVTSFMACCTSCTGAERASRRVCDCCVQGCGGANVQARGYRAENHGTTWLVLLSLATLIVHGNCNASKQRCQLCLNSKVIKPVALQLAG